MSDCLLKDWLSPVEVAQLTGFSAGFIRTELRAGELTGVQVTSETRPRKFPRWRIAKADAITYAIRMGVKIESPVTADTGNTP